MKFWNGEYTITKKYAEELRRKLSDFQEHENLRKAFHLVIVTTYAVKRNEYYNMVQNEVTMNAFFEYQKPLQEIASQYNLKRSRRRMKDTFQQFNAPVIQVNYSFNSGPYFVSLFVV